MNRTDPSEPFDLMRFLRSVEVDPVFDLEGSNESIELRMEASSQAREGWIEHVLARYNHGAVEYGNRSLSRPLSELLIELEEEAADLGSWAVVAHFVLVQENLDPEAHELLARALHDAAGAGARAWARLNDAWYLLRSIEDARDEA